MQTRPGHADATRRQWPAGPACRRRVASSMLLRAWVVGSCRTEPASRHRTTTFPAPSTDYLIRPPHRAFPRALAHPIAEKVVFFPSFSLVGQVQVLEMGVGLALRHLAPGTLGEQPLAELFDSSTV